MNMQTVYKTVGIIALGISAGACVEVGLPASGSQTFAELNPIQDMHASPAFKDQEFQLRYDVAKGEWVKTGMRLPPNQTVHVAYRPYRFKADPEGAKQLVNPVAVTTDSLRYGKLLYETNCLVCHGATGQGDGYVVGPQKYPVPPVLTSARLRSWEDAEIYHVITNGQGRMWSYKNNLYPLERWAVVNYVRALQRADYPEPQDLERIKE
jgi:mono/diheme cytochrome c family protein